ncbi:MAG: HNH endonuclease signature motif containing protein [Allorhizobium sp.]
MSPETFWSRLDRSPASGCWEWTRAIKSNGYGVAWLDGKCHHAHRLAYSLANGPLVPGLDVRHACDNRKCCNPAHLSLGTRQENMQDAVDRGRVRRGEDKKNATLNVAKVREIKTSTASSADLARSLDVSYGVVHAVRSGKTWRHVHV